MKKINHHFHKQRKNIGKHLSAHKHKYLFGTFGTFAIVKMILLFAGFLGITNRTGTFAQTPEVELNSGNITQAPFNCSTGATSCYLSNKGITSIAPDTFVNHTNLQKLILRDNQISVLPDGIFDNLTELRELYLNNNQISVLPDGIFDNLSNLQLLYLRSNQISVLPEGIFDNLSSLRNLELYRNQISGSLDVLCDLTGLQYLSISYNHFSGPIPACFFDFEDLRRGGGMIDYNYLSLDGLTSEQEEFLNTYFYYEGDMISFYYQGDEFSDRKNQYFFNDMSVDQTITASGSDRWDISMAYTNGLSALDHAFVYYTMGDFNLQNSSASYTTGGVLKDYGISGDVCYDSFYYNNTGGYRNAINELIMTNFWGTLEDFILELLDYQSGTSDRGSTYIGDGSDMGKYFIDWIQYGDDFSFQGNVLIEFMDKVLGLDYTAITGCGTPGIPAYIFDLGALGSGATGTITFRITSQDVIAPTAYIHSSDRIRVDPSTGNNSMILSLSGQGSSIETGNVTTGEKNNNQTIYHSPGGSTTLTKDVCTPRDCSNSYYDGICGSCDLDEYKEQQKHGAPDIQFLIQDKELFNQAVEIAKKSTKNSYSNELLQAYVFAKDLGITTMPTIDKADIEGNLIRSHLAKMMTNFAIKTLQIPLNTGAKCDFPDMKNQSEEMQLYAKLSCQLGLMGQGVESFKPNDVVTRAEFGTVLSRMLRGDEFEGGNTYYENHLTALKADGIVTKIENPSAKELRGRTMLMMMRMFEKK